jgi:hypothetical protein
MASGKPGAVHGTANLEQKVVFYEMRRRDKVSFTRDISRRVLFARSELLAVIQPDPQFRFQARGPLWVMKSRR